MVGGKILLEPVQLTECLLGFLLIIPEAAVRSLMFKVGDAGGLAIDVKDTP